MSISTEQTLNDVGISSDPAIVDPDSEGIIETVDTGSSDDDSSAETITGSEGKDDAAATDQTDTGKALSGDDDRFDKHPRWQEMRSKTEEAERRAIAAEAENKVLKDMGLHKAPVTHQAPAMLPYVDIRTLTDEQVADAMRDNPKAFSDNLYLQIKTEAIRDAMAAIKAETAKEQQDRVLQETYVKFEDNNPDFRPMWNKGEIQKFMESNPGHNPMSAYQAMTLPARIEAATKEAVEKARKTFETDQLAKRKATTLGKTTQSPQPDTDAELKNAKDSGGVVSVIAHRLARMRAG